MFMFKKLCPINYLWVSLYNFCLKVRSINYLCVSLYFFIFFFCYIIFNKKSINLFYLTFNFINSIFNNNKKKKLSAKN